MISARDKALAPEKLGQYLINCTLKRKKKREKIKLKLTEKERISENRGSI